MDDGRRTPSPRRRAVAAATAVVCALCLFAGAVTGTVEEQRARLPPPAECSDAVEGLWMAMRFTESWGEWYEFTLTIRRASPGSDELVGDINSHFWYGGKEDQKPPPCKPGGMEQIVKMPGKGKVDKQRVVFGSTTYTVEKLLCGEPGLYAPDNFSGTIDPALQEFQSVNNDGNRSVNEPNVFRRVKCFDPPRKQPQLNVTPPGYSPTRKKSGCGL